MQIAKILWKTEFGVMEEKKPAMYEYDRNQ